MGRLVRRLRERFELLAFFHAGRLPTWRHEIQRKASFRTLGKGGVKQLPKPLIAGIDPPRRGHVAEWLRSGLQKQSSPNYQDSKSPLFIGVSCVSKK